MRFQNHPVMRGWSLIGAISPGAIKFLLFSTNVVPSSAIGNLLEANNKAPVYMEGVTYIHQHNRHIEGWRAIRSEFIHQRR
jgi:hypothetical protein